jgi:hypothetical protein
MLHRESDLHGEEEKGRQGFCGKTRRNIPLERPTSRRQDIKINLMKIGWAEIDWIHLL